MRTTSVGTGDGPTGDVSGSGRWGRKSRGVTASGVVVGYGVYIPNRFGGSEWAMVYRYLIGPERVRFR